MIVYELIEQLKSMPPNAIVVVRGYEDGVNEADRIAECNIEPFSYGKHWYYGSYEIAQRNGKKAVFISSARDDTKDDTDV